MECNILHTDPESRLSGPCTFPHGHIGPHSFEVNKLSGSPIEHHASVSVKVEQHQLDVAQWWLDLTAADLRKTLPKSSEYGGGSGRPGSADLRIIGENMAELMGWQEIDDAVAQEVGAWFYVQGKSARLISDYQQRRAGKADTWFDISVYAMMARRLQECGQWP